MNIFIDCFLCFTTLLLPAQRFSFCADFPSVLTCSMLPLTVSIFCLFTLSASHPSPYKTQSPPPCSPPSPESLAQQSPWDSRSRTGSDTPPRSSVSTVRMKYSGSETRTSHYWLCLLAPPENVRTCLLLPSVPPRDS